MEIQAENDFLPHLASCGFPANPLKHFLTLPFSGGNQTASLQLPSSEGSCLPIRFLSSFHLSFLSLERTLLSLDP